VETFNEYFIAIAENVKRQSKNNFINDDNDTMDSYTRFMEQAFTNLYPSTELKFIHSFIQHSRDPPKWIWN